MSAFFRDLQTRSRLEHATAKLREHVRNGTVPKSLKPKIEPNLGASAVQTESEIQKHFADAAKREIEIQRLIDGATLGQSLGLQVNAGHGLNYENLAALNRVPHLVELNIGHSIVSRAVFTGLSVAVSEMLGLMKSYRVGL